MLGVGTSIWNRALSGKGDGSGGNPPSGVTPIHSLDLTAAPSASNSFDAYGLATSRTVTDYNGRIVEIPANAVPMGGLRPVRNLLSAIAGLSSSDLTTTGWTEIRTGTSIDGKNEITLGADASAVVNARAYVDSDGKTVAATAVVSCAAGTETFRFKVTHGGVIDYWSPVLTATTTPQRFVFVPPAFGVGGNSIYFGVGNHEAVSKSLIVDECFLQDITHRADLSTAPDEYVSTDDDYGTGVNGFRYFDTELANTVASNVVTEGTGASVAGWLDYQPGATNLQDYSNDFTTRTAGLSGDGSVPVVTAAYADGPLGAASATRVQLNRGTSTTGYSVLNKQIAVVNSNNYTESFYVRTVSGSATIAIYYAGVPFSIYNASTVSITEQWIRVKHTETAISSISGYIGFGLLGPAYCICDQTADILVCAQQFEVGTVPTAYIPTTIGSASRPAMSPAPTISGLVGTEDARLTVKGLASDLVTPDPTDTTERTLDVDNTDGEFDTLPSPIKVLSIDVYNDGERPD